MCIRDSGGAAPTGGTTTTFSLVGGALDVTVQTAAALTGGGLTTAGNAHDVTGSLGLVMVDDGRSAGATGWVASAASTAGFNLTTPADGSQSDNVYYEAAMAGTPTRVTATPTAKKSIKISAPVVNGTNATNNNTASWTPTLTVTLPSTAAIGDYTGTVTTSVT